jgi:alanyl-tRNA synthetase
VTGLGALEYVRGIERTASAAAARLGVAHGALSDRIGKILDRERDMEREIETLTRRLAEGAAEGGPEERTVNGVLVRALRVPTADPRRSGISWTSTRTG